MFTIRKEFKFEASHSLDYLHKEHPCTRLHGHSYTVIAELKAETLNKEGMVRDYRDLEIIKKSLDNRFDHRHLNDIFDSSIQTTAENLAKYLYEAFKGFIPELHAIEVKETEKTSARYEQTRI